MEIRGLSVSFRIGGQYFAAVDDLDLDIPEGETLAVMGESGCGKSSLAHSIIGLHDPSRTRVEGYIGYRGQNLLTLCEAELNKIRGGHIGMVFQDPASALNPLMRIGEQIAEPLMYHTSLTKTEREGRAAQLLRDVDMPRPEQTYWQYPHELSGGMCQRAVIASALVCRPALLIADEPTTALDVTVQARILELLRDIDASILLITHDPGVVAETADRVAVMYAGQIVETAPCAEIFANPLHPYTRSLLSAMPRGQDRLYVIPGAVPSLENMPRTGCRFGRRIARMPEDCHDDAPALREVSPGHYVRCSCHAVFELCHC